MLRLAVRVRREQAELVLAELLELAVAAAFGLQRLHEAARRVSGEWAALLLERFHDAGTGSHVARRGAAYPLTRVTVLEHVRTDITSAMKATSTQLDDAELEAIVAAAIAETGARGTGGEGTMGQVMKAAMAKAGGRADGRRVSARVREALG